MLLKKAPVFSLPDSEGDMHSLSDYKGKWVVLYFYLKDNTPKCTKEALDFTELKDKFERFNAVIIGISKDNSLSHDKFISRHDLKIILLSDEYNDITKEYDVYKLKNFMGKTSMGTIRTTFLINPDGFIVERWDKVRVKEHVNCVLEKLQNILE